MGTQIEKYNAPEHQTKTCLFEFHKMLLRLMGNNMSSDQSSNSFSLKHIAVLLLVVSAEYPLINYVFYHKDNVELITAGLSVFFTNLLTVIKITTFLSHKRGFWLMMHDFNVLHNRSQHAEGAKYLEVANRLSARISKTYGLSCFFTGLYFTLNPIVKIVRATWHGTVYERELPMPLKFHFNDVDTPGYEIGFIYTVFVTISVVSFASAIDGLFISFAINLRGHFQVLQNFLRTLDYKLAADQFEHQIAEFVNYHVTILDLAKKLRTIYTNIVIGQFLITSLQVCVIIYQIVTQMDSIMSLVVYISFALSILLQLFIYCYGGEIIKIESLMVSIAIQLSNWYELAPKHRKMFQLIMMRSQRETLIKAGFYEASLANFMSIIRAGLSYIALIQSIE